MHGFFLLVDPFFSLVDVCCPFFVGLLDVLDQFIFFNETPSILESRTKDASLRGSLLLQLLQLVKICSVELVRASVNQTECNAVCLNRFKLTAPLRHQDLEDPNGQPRPKRYPF